MKLRALSVVFLFLLMGVEAFSCAPQPLEHRMLCQPGSSLDGVSFTLDLALCAPVDREDPRWCCTDWQPWTVYCECVTVQQVEEWESSLTSDDGGA